MDDVKENIFFYDSADGCQIVHNMLIRSQCGVNHGRRLDLVWNSLIITSKVSCRLGHANFVNYLSLFSFLNCLRWESNALRHQTIKSMIKTKWLAPTWNRLVYEKIAAAIQMSRGIPAYHVALHNPLSLSRACRSSCLISFEFLFAKKKVPNDGKSFSIGKLRKY